MKRKVKTLQPISNLFLRKKRAEHGVPQFLKLRLSESLQITIDQGISIIHVKNFFVLNFHVFVRSVKFL